MEFKKITGDDMIDFLKTKNIEWDGYGYNGTLPGSDEYGDRISVYKDSLYFLSKIVIDFKSHNNSVRMKMNSTRCIIYGYPDDSDYTNDWRKFLLKQYGKDYANFLVDALEEEKVEIVTKMNKDIQEYKRKTENKISKLDCQIEGVKLYLEDEKE